MLPMYTGIVSIADYPAGLATLGGWECFVAPARGGRASTPQNIAGGFSRFRACGRREAGSIRCPEDSETGEIERFSL